jgi:chromosome segregation ATPase
VRAKVLSLPGVARDSGKLAGSFVTYRANAYREAIRQRTRLDAAEDALTAAETSLKQAHTRFDAADDQVAAAEDALHAAYADREQARRDRYAARQATSGPAPWWNGSSAG